MVSHLLLIDQVRSVVHLENNANEGCWGMMMKSIDDDDVSQHWEVDIRK